MDQVGELPPLLQALFRSFTNQYLAKVVYFSFGTNAIISVVALLAFCIIRPLNGVVYAPKLRSGDTAKAPPPISKGFFAWMTPLLKTRETDLIDKLGLDAIIFLRFLRMLRSIFICLTVGGFIVGFTNLIATSKQPVKELKPPANNWFLWLTQYGVHGKALYMTIVFTWIFDIIVCYFLWRNYAQVVALKKHYFQSVEYQKALHARTVLVYDIPSNAMSDEGLLRLVAALENDTSLTHQERATIGRDVMELPKLIEQHSLTVRKLESVLAKYLKNPDRLPVNRPIMKPFKEDQRTKGEAKIDAIEYLDERMTMLEHRIKEIRATVELRRPFPYGFVSFPTVRTAHVTALAAKGKHPKGTTITLAPRPSDVLWQNLTKSKAERVRNRIIGYFYFILLSAFWIVPNAFVTTFLANLSQVAAIYPPFNQQLIDHPYFYAFVQGVGAPVVAIAFFLTLPVLMRRISAWEGALSKTSRERQVTSKLYSFFLFNNLIIFSICGGVFVFALTVVGIQKAQKKSPWDAILEARHNSTVFLIRSMYNISIYWMSYLLARNLGALLDLIQLMSLISRWFQRKFMHPTPRQMIEWSAPQYMDVATYYNYFLFYSTIAMVFGPIQPLIFLITSVYFIIDCWLRKYAYMYVFVTKHESEGNYWRVLFNRLLIATGFGNLVTGGVVWAQLAQFGKNPNANSTFGFAVLPLIPLLIGFKIYCKRTFDDDTRFYTSGESEETIGLGKPGRTDNVGTRYGHPALTKRLLTPMVHENAKRVLHKVYQLRSSVGVNEPYSSSFGADMSDISLDNMPKDGKAAGNTGFGHLAFVSQTDYAMLDNRSEFGFGGFDSEDNSRAGTPVPGAQGRRTPGGSEFGGYGGEPSGQLRYMAAANGRDSPGPGYQMRTASPGPGYPMRTDSPGPGYPARTDSPSRGPYLGSYYTQQDGNGSSSDLQGLLPGQQAPGVSTPGVEMGPNLASARSIEQLQSQRPQQGFSYVDHQRQEFGHLEGDNEPYNGYRR